MENTHAFQGMAVKLNHARIQLGFAGSPMITGPCCDIGWYMHLDDGALTDLTIYLDQMVPEDGLVLATPYPVGASFAVQRCTPSCWALTRGNSLDQVLAAAGTVKQKPSKLKKEMVQHNKLSQNNKADKKKNKTKFSGMSHKTALSKDFARFKSKFVEAHTKVATLKNGAADPGTKQKKAAMKGPNFYPEPLRAEYARFVAKKRAENSEDAGDTKANAVEPIIDEQGAPVEEELLQWVKEFY